MRQPHRYFSALLGVGSGAGGLAASAACAGGSCLSCFGCVAGAAGVVAATLATRMFGAMDADRANARIERASGKGDGDGLAERSR